jgi:hypothetical protein
LTVQYLQPHYPFLDSEVKFDKGQLYDQNNNKLFCAGLMTGKISVKKSCIWESYKNNLEYVLDSIRDLSDTLDGRTVVTSDHGNVVGERSFPTPIREWGNPREIHTCQLVEFPWLDLGGNNRKIVPDPPANQVDDKSIKVVTDRLESLGYK